MALSILVNAIVNTYFSNSYGMIMISNNPTYSSPIPTVILKTDSSLNETLFFNDYGCQDIFIDHPSHFDLLSEIEHAIKIHDERFNFRKYLVLSNSTEIFESPTLDYIANFLVVIPVEDGFQLLTHKYVGKTHNEPEILDVWFTSNQSFLEGNNLYPDKISNQQGRILRCATFNYKPYSITTGSPKEAVGSENSVAFEYARRHNMTVRYVLDDYEWGKIYDNWTGNGILGNLATDKADIGYGALYTWEHEYHYLDLSKPIVRTGITCLVPAPKLAAGWLTPFFPFSASMWIGTGMAFVVLYLSAVGIIIFRNKFMNCPIPDDALLTVFRILLTQALPESNKLLKGVLQHLFIIFLFSVLLTSSYSSGLATVMTIPRFEGAIQTVWDLADSGMYWGATQDAWIFSIQNEERPQYVEIVSKFIPTTEEELLERSRTNDFAFSLERLPSGHFAIGSYVTQEAVRKLRLMHEDLYWEYCVIMTHKNSVLLDSIDMFILEVSQAGLVKFWETKAVETHMDLMVQDIVQFYNNINQKEQDKEMVELTWVHVEGAFGILALGYALAIVCFVAEIMRVKMKK